MSEHTLRRLLAVLGGLVVIYLGVRLVSYLARPRGDSGGSLGAALHQLAADTIASASITSPTGAHIALQRQGVDWTANGYPADSVAVARFLDGAHQSTLGPLAARSAATHAALGITDSAAWKLTVRTAHDSLRLLLGSEGPQYPSGYARLPGNDTVYTVLGDLRDATTNPLSSWRNRVMLALDTTRIARMTFTRDRQSYQMHRGTGAWVGAAGAADSADLTHAVAVISELSHLQASGFADSIPSHPRETRRIVVQDSAADTLAVVDLRGDGTSDWTATVRGNDQLYQLSTFDADRLVPKRTDLFPTRKGH
jgi:Domain of unknown function (DUF4340)